jgi:hypothetical protein
LAHLMGIHLTIDVDVVICNRSPSGISFGLGGNVIMSLLVTRRLEGGLSGMGNIGST